MFCKLNSKLQRINFWLKSNSKPNKDSVYNLPTKMTRNRLQLEINADHWKDKAYQNFFCKFGPPSMILYAYQANSHLAMWSGSTLFAQSCLSKYLGKYSMNQNIRNLTFRHVHPVKIQIRLHIVQSDQNLHCVHFIQPRMHSFFVQTMENLIRLRRLTGWFESEMDAHVRRYVFSDWVLVWCFYSSTSTLQIDGLAEILSHPAQRFYPVISLPFKIAQQLLYAKKYIHSFYDQCVLLCEMGLLTFGKDTMKEKEQVHMVSSQNDMT